MKHSLVLTFSLLLLHFSNAQKKDYASLANDTGATFAEIRDAFNKNFENKDRKSKGKGWKAFKRWEYFHESRIGADGRLLNHAAINFEEYNKYIGKNSTAANKTAAGVMSAGNWTYIGAPAGVSINGGAGRTTFLRFHPLNPSIMYTGTPAGGLWISLNGGLSWTVLADQIASLGCSDLAIDPTNPSIMYLATGDIDAQDTRSIGILKSTDGGVTWNTTGLVYTATQNSTVARLLIDPTNPQILYAATSSGLLKTTDGGVNWFVTKTGSFKDIEFKPFNYNTVYACSGSAFHTTKNGGITWATSPTNFPGSVGRSCIAVTPADSNYVYMLGGKPGTGSASDYGFAGIVRSTDGGQTFSVMSTTPNIMGWNTSGSDQGGQAWYDIALAVSPTDKDFIFTGGVNIWSSFDGGLTMTNSSNWWGNGTNYAHADQHWIEFLPGSGTTVYAANDGGVFVSSNAGASWADASNGLAIAQQYNLGVSQTNPSLTLTGWQDNGTNLHNGAACEEVIGGDGFECIISWANANEMYGELYYGDIRKSTNGGASFSGIVGSGGTGVDEDGGWNTPFIQHPTNASTLLVGKSEVYRSVNGGTTWTQVGSISGNQSLKKMAYAPSNPNYIYVTDGGGLWVSTDGNTFINKSNQLPNASISGFAIDPANENIVYVSSAGYSNGNKVFVTTDAGNTWQNYSTGLPNIPCNHIVFEPGTYDALYLATDIGVFYRDSTMANWIAYSDGMPNVIVTELEIQTATGKLRASTYGRGLWETDLYTPPVNPTTAAFTSNTTAVCKGKFINFYDQSTNLPHTWNWSFTGGSPSSSTLQFPSVTYPNAGTFPVTLIVSNAAGTDTIAFSSYVTVYPSPVANAGADTTICKGDSVQLNGSGGLLYTWTQGTSLTNAFISNPIAFPAITKNYALTVSDSNGCKATDNVMIYVTQPFSTPTITTNDSLLTASPSGANYTYQWYLNGSPIPGATTQSIITDSSGGDYSVVVNDVEGCFSISSATLTVVGIQHTDGKLSWNFFPNPSSGELSISCSSGFNGIATVRLYSYEGKLIHSEEKQFVSGETHQLNTELPPGLFFLNITNREGKIIGNGKITVVKN